MLRICALVLSLLFLPSTSVQAQRTDPFIPPELQESQEERLAKLCASMRPYFEKWTQRFRMNDWKVTVVCLPVPPWETDDEAKELRGSSLTYEEDKQILVWINPDEPRIEEVIIHELAHGWLAYTVGAQSHQINEETVRMVTELIVDLMRGKKKNDKSSE